MAPLVYLAVLAMLMIHSVRSEAMDDSDDKFGWMTGRQILITAQTLQPIIHAWTVTRAPDSAPLPPLRLVHWLRRFDLPRQGGDAGPLRAFMKMVT
ncbi:hypothetical protein CSOJ01_08358 [Colletotrichum sojae]|uniref:Secreted protein n=1 Tax=Colletotrichum sojae TaxID=2175907 RepID=A0A8H6MT14_9PEZI|nr:hypothetical protein CSOJ01_08358 [Colletotrichum sojae]